MRLGHVMIKIDEQAARRRHSSFMRSKQRINRLLHSSVSSNMSCEGNLHKPVRPYNSHIPTMCKYSTSLLGQVCATILDAFKVTFLLPLDYQVAQQHLRRCL